MSWGRVMARRVRKPFFKCPNCDALYQVVRVEAGPEISDGEIACRVCGSPLAARDGEFVLKYFLLRAARRLGGGVNRYSNVTSAILRRYRSSIWECIKPQT